MWPAKHKDESPNQKFNNDLLDGHLYGMISCSVLNFAQQSTLFVLHDITNKGAGLILL